MDEREALAVLGLSTLPSQWVELQRAFEQKVRLAQSRVQFPVAGMGRDAALDDLDNVKAAWVVLQGRIPCAARRPPKGGIPVSPRSRHVPVPPPSGKYNGLRAIWCTLRVFLPKLFAWLAHSSLALGILVSRLWRATRVIARWVVVLCRGYIKLVCRMTGLRPAAAGIATAAMVFVIPTLLWSTHLLFSSVAEDPDVSQVRHTLDGAVENISGYALSNEASSSGTAPSPVALAEGSVIKVLSWPPAKVYCNGEFLTEAPSPQRFRLRVGEQQILLVSTRGEQRLIAFTAQPNREYVLKYNFDARELNVEEHSL